MNDAARDERWHHTDVEYARWTHRIFTRESLEHEYHEHDGGHDISNNREIVGKYCAANAELRRDPYYPHVTLASPLGFAWNYLHRVRHNRWLTLDESTDGELEYDDLVTCDDDDFDTWRLEHRRYSRRGCMIDAINGGRNRIAVTTLNVARFTVWLHPKMVDVAKPGHPRGWRGTLCRPGQAVAGDRARILRTPPRLGADLPDQGRVGDRGRTINCNPGAPHPRPAPHTDVL